MKILLVHGVGHCEVKPDYYESWQEAITRQLQAAGAASEPEYVGLTFDALFDQHAHTGLVYLAALAELAAAGAWHAIADPISEALAPSRDFRDSLRWKAGMVAQLCVESDLRKALRNLLVQQLTADPPDVIAAHSLGSLITYDFFRNDPRAKGLATGATYLTFGSQINNPFARGRLFPGLIKRPDVKFWYHLYNRQDPVMTAAISIPDPQFLQVLTPSSAGHDPIGTPDNPGYLNHPETAAHVWAALATATGARAFRRNLSAVRRATAKPKRRALLIGINDYPDPANRLEGCVNDTFLVSAFLQERGFDAEDIRVVLDKRATAQAIRERLGWLLEGAGDRTERVLFYSGHGAQMPGYSPKETIDHMDECLVPWDFDWTKERAITDDDFFGFYSNLPFGTRFFAAFDCCHSGGMHRDGGPRVRGLTPPDDIRHRMLQWNRRLHMWEERKLPALNPDFGGVKHKRAQYMGQNGVTYRLGRGMKGRTMPENVYKKLKPEDRGPYLPVILEACQEGGLSYEYRDGVTSYGAFTYSLIKGLRERPTSSFLKAVEQSAATLTKLHYQQAPQILGPKSIVTKRVPGRIG